MLKKTILIIMFTVFLYSPYSNCKFDILFENFSQSKIRIRVVYKRYDSSQDKFIFCCFGSDRLRKKDGLVIGFMRDPSHILFYEKICFCIDNEFYKWGPFNLSNFDLDCDYKIYTNQKNLWFMEYNSDGYFFVTDTVNGILK